MDLSRGSLDKVGVAKKIALRQDQAQLLLTVRNLVYADEVVREICFMYLLVG
jgi:hypothetical protein